MDNLDNAVVVLSSHDEARSIALIFPLSGWHRKILSASVGRCRPDENPAPPSHFETELLRRFRPVAVNDCHSQEGQWFKTFHTIGRLSKLVPPRIGRFQGPGSP